ncbi:MAG: Gfo/Idh/MocA family oxidoreductase [Chloroflexota bacterium]
MKTINLGVIGLGRMGRIYCKHLARHLGGARLAAVSSRTPAAADAVAQMVNNDLNIYPDYRDMMADPEIDGVIVATLTHTHHDIVIAAAEAGKAIFCEKPVALTLEETDKILAAVEKAGVTFQVAFMRRFDKGYAAAKQQIDSGAIGRPVMIQAMSRDPGCPDPAWADPASSGGLIVDLAVHDIDVIRWLMGDEIQRVYAEGAVLACPDLAPVDDIDSAVITVRFKNGALGYIEGARNCGYGYDIRCEIRGTEGTLQVGYLQDTPVVRLTQQGGVSHDIVPWFEERFTPAYRAQIDHFVESLQQGVDPSVGAIDARNSLIAAVAATESHRTGMPVVVEA